MEPNAPSLKQQCPACEGHFTISSASLKKKVHCPRCRAVVTPTEPSKVKKVAEADVAGTPPAPAEWMTRCEALQARIETLEQQVEALMVSPRIPTAPIRERFRNGSPKGREHRLLPETPRGREEAPAAKKTEDGDVFHPAAPAAESMSHEMLKRRPQRPILDVGLFVVTGDGAGRELAESLTGTLTDSGWKVRGVSEDAVLAHSSSGLTLTASPAIPLHLVTDTIHALSDAGLAVTLQFDPERGTNESILIVGSAPRPDDEAHAAKE